MSRYQFRVPKTELGTVWIEVFEPNRLYVIPWWHGTCRIEGEQLPFFRYELTRTDGEWAATKLSEYSYRSAIEWPRGALKKLPSIVLKIGAAWAAENEAVIREKASLHLAHKIKYVGSTDRLDSIRECIADAVALNRLDLLEPLKPLLQETTGEFSTVNRKLAAYGRRALHQQAA